MRLVDILLKLVGVSELLIRWSGSLGLISARKRERLARYAEEIAGCLARLGQACRQGAACQTPSGEAEIVRELGRLAGYVEDVADALKGHLDGRKIAGVKRRLETIATPRSGQGAGLDEAPLERLAEAEGFMRSLADRLRA